MFATSTGSAFYFPSGLVPNDKVPYIAGSGRRTNKNVVGSSERNKVHWHLAMKVNIVLGPPPVVRLKPYICFSEDGTTALDDPKRTSAIRKRFCKNWWNPHWRQLVAQLDLSDDESPRIPFGHAGAGIEQGVGARE